MRFLRQLNREIDEELRTHLELQTRKHVAAGMPLAEARRLAGIEFGSVVSAQEECSEIFVSAWLDRAARNLGHTLRTLRRNPVFAAVSFVLLALGVGANVAVFGIIDALLFRHLPVERPAELVRIAGVTKDQHAGALPIAMLASFKDSRLFSGACGLDTHFNAIEAAGSLHQLGIASFSGNCFRTLGLALQIGRGIEPADDRPGAAPVAVITDALWRSAFRRRPDVLGRTIRFGTNLYSIVGVTKPGFTGLLLGFPEPVMTPLHLDPDDMPWISILARRAAGVSQAKAAAAIEAQSRARLEASVPANYNAKQRQEYLSQRLVAMPAPDGLDYFLRERFSVPLYIAFALCAAILLMTCINVTSLSLARSLVRRREFRTRLALGARPAHIATALLLENAILLAVAIPIGSVCGTAVARALVLRAANMFGNFALDIRFNLPLAAFAGSSALLLLAVFATAAVWQAQRLGRFTTLYDGRRGVTRQNDSAQRVLLAGQVALTLALVSYATVFNASLYNIYAMHFGVDARNVWEIELAPRPGANGHFAAVPYYRNLIAGIGNLPGMVSVSINSDQPFERDTDRRVVALLDGNARASEVRAEFQPVGGGYLKTFGIGLQAGRDFRLGGDEHGERCALVSKSLARALDAKSDLIGRHLRIGDAPEFKRLKIIGVAADARLNIPDQLRQMEHEKPYMVYLDWWQYPEWHRYPVLVVKTARNQLDARAVDGLVDQAGHEYVERIKAVSAELDDSLVENRILAHLSGSFSVLALAIAALGLFGLLSYQVSSRFGEFGIRLALGAQRAQIATSVLRSIAWPLLGGGGAGLLLVFATQRGMAGLLYGTAPLNIGLLSASTGLLVLVAALAALAPVRRACRVDPVKALAHE